MDLTEESERRCWKSPNGPVEDEYEPSQPWERSLRGEKCETVETKETREYNQDRNVKMRVA